MKTRIRTRNNVGSRAKINSLTYTALKMASELELHSFITRNEIINKHFGFTKPGYMVSLMSDLVYSNLLVSSSKGYKITLKGLIVLKQIEERSI